MSLSPSLSPLWSGEHGPGLEGTCHRVVVSLHVTMSPTAAPPPLPRCPSRLRCPATLGLRPSGSGGARWSPHSAGTCPGLLPPLPLSAFGTAGFAPGSPAPDPARPLSPSVHVASAGRARAARTPPSRGCPGGAAPGDSAGRGACDNVTALPAAARRNFNPLESPCRGWLGPADPPRPEPAVVTSLD